MNRTLLALAVTAALAVPLTAQAAPSVYGLMNLSVDMVDVEFTTTDEFQVNSNSSRIGIKGEEDLGNGYSAVYKAEWGVSGDGNAADLGQRDRYLGLKAAWGTVKLGNYDSPLKSSQGSVDVFNDMTYLDMAANPPANTSIAQLNGDIRLANSIGYESPKIGDAITVKLTLQPGETTGGDDSLADAVSASVAYEQAGLYLAAAIDKGDTSGVQLNFDTTRLTAVYTMDALQLGAMLQSSKASAGGGSEENSVLLSAAYTAGKNVFKGQLVMSDTDFASPDDQKISLIALGMDHNFTQMTKVFAQAGVGKTENAAGALVATTDERIVSVGMQTKF